MSGRGRGGGRAAAAIGAVLGRREPLRFPLGCMLHCSASLAQPHLRSTSHCPAKQSRQCAAGPPGAAVTHIQLRSRCREQRGAMEGPGSASRIMHCWRPRMPSMPAARPLALPTGSIGNNNLQC